MGFRNSYEGCAPSEGLDPYAARMIRCRTHQLIRRHEFGECDREDIEQELALDLIQRLPQFDSARAARETFIARVVEHRIYELIGERNTARRRARRADASVHDDQLLDNRLRVRRAGGCDRDEIEQVELRLDVESVLGRLPEVQREICSRLLAATIAQVARAKGMPRTTVNGLLRKVRPLFASGALDEYLRLVRRSVESASK